MEIIIKENKGYAFPNYFDIYVRDNGQDISWSSALKFFEIIQQMNKYVNLYNISPQDHVIYKIFDENWKETDSIHMTLAEFRGMSA